MLCCCAVMWCHPLRCRKNEDMFLYGSLLSRKKEKKKNSTRSLLLAGGGLPAHNWTASLLRSSDTKALICLAFSSTMQPCLPRLDCQGGSFSSGEQMGLHRSASIGRCRLMGFLHFVSKWKSFCYLGFCQM